MSEHVRGAVPKTAPPRKSHFPGPAEPGARPRSGRILTLVLGQGHGFIRLTDRRKVFFHRSDLREGTTFGALAVGEVVTFDLVDDPISGPRAVRVERRRRIS